MSHSILNPSSSARWLTCLGSVPLVLGCADESSEYADEGTAAHQLATWALNEARPCVFYLGRKIDVCNDDGTVRRSFNVDDSMASYVQVYVDSINDKMHETAIMLVEQRVSSGIVSMLYGPVDGTADTIIIMPQFKLIDVNDLKFGKGERVDAPNNSQLRLYGCGAIELVKTMAPMLGLPADLSDWRVRTVIHQPRLDHYSDELLTVNELLAWRDSAQVIVDRIDEGVTTLTPSEKGCRWCPLKATCPKLAEFTLQSVLSEFKDVPDLSEWGVGKALEKVELVEQWVKAVRAKAWALLDSGVPVPGWKLAEGREGNCKWDDPKAVESLMLNTYRMTHDQVYTSELVTPTKEWQKRFAKQHPIRMNELLPRIKREPGKKILVRDTDTRPSVGLNILDHFKG